MAPCGQPSVCLPPHRDCLLEIIIFLLLISKWNWRFCIEPAKNHLRVPQRAEYDCLQARYCMRIFLNFPVKREQKLSGEFVGLGYSQLSLSSAILSLSGIFYRYNFMKMRRFTCCANNRECTKLWKNHNEKFRFDSGALTSHNFHNPRLYEECNSREITLKYILRNLAHAP
jgi:hypothetical protein